MSQCSVILNAYYVYISVYSSIFQYIPVYLLLCSAGGEIVSTFGNPEKVKLGRCKVIEEVMIGEDKLIRFSGRCV